VTAPNEWAREKGELLVEEKEKKSIGRPERFDRKVTARGIYLNSPGNPRKKARQKKTHRSQPTGGKKTVDQPTRGLPKLLDK